MRYEHTFIKVFSITKMIYNVVIKKCWSVVEKNHHPIPKGKIFFYS